MYAEITFRGWYPGRVDEEVDTANGSLLSGIFMAGGDRVWMNRLERLIHFELEDLAVNEAYLEPTWRSFTKGLGQGKKQQSGMPTTLTSDASSTRKKRPNFVASGSGNEYIPCDDCKPTISYSLCFT